MSHTVKFTLLKCTVRWALAHSPGWNAHRHYRAPEWCHSPQRKLWVPAGTTPAPTGGQLLQSKLLKAGTEQQSGITANCHIFVEGWSLNMSPEAPSFLLAAVKGDESGFP